MMITNDELKQKLDELKQKFENNESDIKTTIASAFTLGMHYRENQIREGIDIVFKTLRGY